MQKLTTHKGQAAFLPLDNIDTDMIIAKQYLKTIKRSGLGKWLFADMRYDAQGKPRPDFILNQKPKASILLAGKNFGCGSSREHAPWSLMDFGLRAVIASGFADIFYSNCFKNGLLPVSLPPEAVEALAARDKDITIDLEAQTVSCDDLCFGFKIEPDNKKTLLEGLDGIARILQQQDAIKAFEERHFAQQPWLRKGS
ncbi:MAG: 3-isopropylmalate dehydratase small subunit [Alphaproteobacteria bacterium]|nr:3-isopropylmalate dehydratase small subunit [Alphaproteobacteria bacterium]